MTRAAVGRSYATDDACSRCVANSLFELEQPNINVSHAVAGHRIRTGDAPCCDVSPHMQGIARLADVLHGGTRVGRVVLTHNLWSAGLTYSEQALTATTIPPDAIYSSNVDAQEIYELSIRNERAHPGGAQSHGNVLAVAMEQGPASHASVDFFRFPPVEGGMGYFLNRLVLDGSRGEPLQPDQNAASAAGFLMLGDGHYLVVVAGAKHGVQGIWFYRSDRQEIERNTQWEFIGFWGLNLDLHEPIDNWPAPTCAGRNKRAVKRGCFGGASAIALLADCDGSVRMVVMNGTDHTPGREYQWNQVYRLTQDYNGAVVPVWEYSQWDGTGSFQTNNPAFRWTGGLYVSEAGLPVVFNSERRTNGGSNNHVNGDLYFRSLVAAAALAGEAGSAPAMRPPFGGRGDLPGDSGESAPAELRRGAR